MGDELKTAYLEKLKQLEKLPSMADAIKAQNALNDTHPKPRFRLGEPNGFYFRKPENKLPRLESKRR